MNCFFEIVISVCVSIVVVCITLLTLALTISLMKGFFEQIKED
jgi:hypothetical protein